jgi:hypothetical protein
VPAFAGAGAKDKPAKTDVPSVSGSSDDDSAPDPGADPDADNAHPSGKDRHEDKGTQGKSTSDPDDNDRGPERNSGNPGADKPFVSGDGAGGIDKLDQDGNNGCGNDDDFEDDNEGWCGHKPKPTHQAPSPSVSDTHETKPCPAGTMPSGTDHGCKPNPCTEDSTMPTGSEKDCDHKPVVEGKTETKTDTTCPEAGALPVGGTMPAGCMTSTTATTDTLTPGAVLASELQGDTTPAGTRTEVLGIQIERGEVAAAAAAAPAGASVLGSVVTQGAALARTGFGLTMLLGIVALTLLAVGFALRRFGRTGTEL